MNLEGGKLKLVAYEPEYWMALNRWVSDKAYKNYFRNMPIALTIDQMKNFSTIMNMNMLMVINKETDSVAGFVTWDNIRMLQRSCEFGMLIDKDSQHSGACHEAFLLALKHLFFSLGFHKVTANALGGDEEVSARLMRAGFQLEGVMRDHVWMDGKWYHEERYSILENEFRIWMDNYEKGNFLWASRRGDSVLKNKKLSVV